MLSGGEHKVNKRQIKRYDALSQVASARLVETAVVAMARLPAESLRGAGRGQPRIAGARQVAMYLSHVVFGLSLTRVGICFGRDRTTVSHACSQVEDRRDDPALELGLSAIEAGLLALSDRLSVELRS